MEALINYLHYANPIAIALAIVCSISIAARLYRNAPEKKDLGFVKYWQTLMMDSFPSEDKNILIYDDSSDRLLLFKLHRVVSVAVMAFIALNIVLGMLLE